MCPKRCGRPREPRTPTTIPPAIGEVGAPGVLRRKLRKHFHANSAAAGENRRQFLGWNNFELLIRAVGGLLVWAPTSKMRHVPESACLHMLVRDFHNEFGPQRLPRKIFALAPAALDTRHALAGRIFPGSMLSPLLPGVIL